MGETNDQPYNLKLRLLTRTQPDSNVGADITETNIGNWSDLHLFPLYKKADYIIRNQMRLSGDISPSSLHEVENIVCDIFGRVVGQDLIADLSRAHVIEVVIPFEREDYGWTARLFPWEDILILATKRLRTHKLTVIRHLDMFPHPPQPPPVKTDEIGLLRVRSTPGKLSEIYDFRSESNLVHLALGLDEDASRDISNPSLLVFEKNIADFQPNIVHLSVLDTQYLASVGPDMGISLPKGEYIDDGIILAGQSSNDYDPVHFSVLADALTNPAPGQIIKPPHLVAFATCYSGGRMAPIAVSKGVGNAIGFRSLLTDTLSEAFFREFYHQWRTADWDTLKAFELGVAVIRDHPPELRSTAILWSAQSLLALPEPIRTFIPMEEVPEYETTYSRRAFIYSQTGTGDGASDKLQPLDPYKDVVVLCVPQKELNYCALHNRRELFKKFEIRKNETGPLPSLDVTVELLAENERSTWCRSLQFDTTPGSKDLLKEGVHVPLGSRSFRRVQENTRTSLYVTVVCDGKTCYQETTDITLLPIDQWADTEEDRRWLPSFVLPRDRAINKIMVNADRFLKALTDDHRSGFDGYQSVDLFPDSVDLQARAIWYALLYDHRLQYINPPPTYAKMSQRLRTPSQVLGEGRGTCIDLALLFASCLEYVGIYPVIVLIAGHAFPGWWRDYDSYNQFSGFKFYESNTEEDIVTQLETMPKTPRYEEADWIVRREGYREVIGPITEGSLAVIESTMLCTGGGFADALTTGRENLMDASIFDALIDVQRARSTTNPVTPLPIVYGAEHE